MRWLKSASKKLGEKIRTRLRDLDVPQKIYEMLRKFQGGRYNIWYNLLGRTIGKSDPQTDIQKIGKPSASPDAISPLAFIIKTIDAIDWGLGFLARERFRRRCQLGAFFLFIFSLVFFVWDAGLIQAVVQETNTGGQHNFRYLIYLIAANDGRKLHITSWTLYSCTLYTSLLDI